MLQLHSFAAVKATLVPIFEKLSLLLAMLLCSAFAFAVPATAAPALATENNQSAYSSDEATFSIVAGEVSAGDAEGILQKAEKTLWSPITRVFLQLLYPQPLITEAVPSHRSFHSGANILHSILSKGP
ncbi:hypothetical protein DXT99_02190 [Pontibacter diazotrophicus]|uniref:Uncharacterized protein n=1 Tax=Pontibacter diazotrophicus TaxID=1400979 RepID=A0A3D8LGU2_9BACT|nr:hypothetical protein [Pontibacter diazotrophicus]RDV16615.1 hypothetical protein DXT99_02190 [Pontibacter diazotrophicus]